jgi:hypothetical protein
VGERRDVERRAQIGSIRYSVTVLEFRDRRRIDLRGEVVDISESGIGITTDFPLERGHVLTFSDNIGHPTGIVEWSSRVQNNGYRVGVKFAWEAENRRAPGQ